MTYLSGKAKKKKNYIRYSIYIVLFVSIVSFWVPTRKYIYSIIEPVVGNYGTIKQSFTFFPEFFHTYIVSRRTLVAREKDLESQIENLQNIVAEKDARLREYTAISFSEGGDSAPILAYPIMQDFTKVYSTVLLSKGFKDGVTVGAIVSLQGNQVVCTIREVYKSSSQCLLLTSSSVVTEGVTSSSSITLSLTGRGGHFLANIERETPVSVGEIVYLRSNPKFVIGTVKQVANNNQDTSWHVFVEGAYNPVTSSIFYVH